MFTTYLKLQSVISTKERDYQILVQVFVLFAIQF